MNEKIYLVALMVLMPVAAFAQEVVAIVEEPSTALWFLVAAACVSFASSLLSAFIPMPKEGSVWVPIRKVLDILASNVFNAKNQTK